LYYTRLLFTETLKGFTMGRLVKWGCGGFVVLILCIGVLLVGASLTSSTSDEPVRVGEITGSSNEESSTTNDAETEEVPESAEAEEGVENTETSNNETEATNETEAAADTTEAASESEDANYNVGDIIEIGDVVLIVLGWEVVTNDTFTPDDGNQFVAVDILFINKSDNVENLSSILQMTLRDETGQKYDTDFMASAATQSGAPEGELSSGERVRGQVAFQVPQTFEELTFVYDASVFGTGKVFVVLGSEPTAVEPPTQVTGEKEQTANAVGEAVEVEDLTVTVNEVLYPTGDGFIQANEGNKFVVVDLTVENRSTEATAISTIAQMELKDATGQRYTLDLMASQASGGSTPDGELAPGEVLRGQVGYQVPADATGLVFIFDASVFGDGRIRFALP
jgi:hypothetical protein